MPPDSVCETAQKKSVHTLYQKKTVKGTFLILFLVILIIGSALIAAGTGTISLSFQDTLLAIGHSCNTNLQVFLHGSLPEIAAWYDTLNIIIPSPSDARAELVVAGFRLPRILLAILTGMNLAVAGAVMQGLLRNPLVSPFTLGVSSAASFGAALAIAFGPGLLGIFFLIGDNTFISVMAFLFGWLSMFIVYGISRSRGVNQSTLILSGVVIGYLFSAGVMALKYFSSDEKLRDLSVWLMGGMWGATWNAIIILLPVSIICLTFVELRAWDLNALAAGDDIAKNLGINVPRLRLISLAVVTLSSSTCIAFTGVIGFIGLMSPHICRMLIGNDYRYLIPCAALLGAIILLLSDTVARIILSPVEIPVGIVMYIFGGLFFIFLILRSRGRGLY
jgi:iron complex transport system permease protein